MARRVSLAWRTDWSFFAAPSSGFNEPAPGAAPFSARAKIHRLYTWK